MKFYNLGEIRRHSDTEGHQIRCEDFDSAPEEFLGATVNVGSSEFLVVYPKFLDEKLYVELANTLASRYAMESGSLEVGPPSKLTGKQAWNRLQGVTHVEGQGFHHHWRGLDLPILVFVIEDLGEALK